MADKSQDFTQLFRPIQKFLAEAPKGTPGLREAIIAYNAIIEIIYGPEQGIAVCGGGPVKFIPLP